MKPNRFPVLVPRFLLASLALGLGACTNTRLEQSWKAPEVGALSFKKVMVIAATPDGAIRRTAEDAMKAQVSTIPVVASYEVAPEHAVLTDRTRMAALIQEAGVDGVVVMRLISDDREVQYVPGSPMPRPYVSFWGYYTRPYAMSAFYWEPGTIVNDRLVGIETNIYDVASENLVWSGYTKTRNPRDVATLIAEIADAVKSKLRSQKLIP